MSDRFGFLVTHPGYLFKDCAVVVDVLFGIGFAWLDREGFRDDERLMAGPVVGPEIRYAALYVRGPETRILLEFLPAVTDLIETAMSLGVPGIVRKLLGFGKLIEAPFMARIFFMQ